MCMAALFTTAQMLGDGWTHEQDEFCPYGGTFLSHTRKQSSETHNQVDGPQGRDPKLKKPDVKGHRL